MYDHAPGPMVVVAGEGMVRAREDAEAPGRKVVEVEMEDGYGLCDLEGIEVASSCRAIPAASFLLWRDQPRSSGLDGTPGIVRYWGRLMSESVCGSCF
jgi:hypothetical protein